jgi:transposase
MDSTELYTKILQLEEPWKVTNVEMDAENQQINIHLGYDRKTANFICPECGLATTPYDQRETRKWRHMDSCQFETYLIAKIPRGKCPLHGVKTPPIPWAEPHSRFTLLFETLAIHLLQATQVQAKAAKLLRLSPGQVHDLMQRAVARGMKRRDSSEVIEHMSLDEKSFQRGHHYMTVLGDSLGKRVIDVTENRTQEAVEMLLREALTPEQRESVESVSMDMWPAFMNAQKTTLPEADTVHDRFHIAAYLNDAVDKTRRSEDRDLTKRQDTSLKKTKYLWLRSGQNLTEKQQESLLALQGLELETAKAWAFKESFRSFFACQTEAEARSFFFTWYDAVIAFGNPYLVKVAQMLKNHLAGLLSYIRHRVTNAIAEGMNASIQQIKSNAKGFRRFASFRVAILFFLGKLDLYPHTSP